MTPDYDFKVIETLRNKNDFNTRYYHCFVLILSHLVSRTTESFVIPWHQAC